MTAAQQSLALFGGVAAVLVVASVVGYVVDRNDPEQATEQERSDVFGRGRVCIARGHWANTRSTHGSPTPC